MITDRASANRAAALDSVMQQYVTLIRAHDHVHPDRNVCGGIGGCRLMQGEHDLEEEIAATLRRLTRDGYAVAGVTVARDDPAEVTA